MPGATTERNSTRGDETRRLLLDGAEEVLRTSGYAGASARTIAAAAGVNAALVFYHFGGVDALLLATLDRSSAQRMERHAATAAGAGSVEQLVEAAVEIYRADLEGGYLAQFSELVAAAVTRPALRAEIAARAEPWVAFVEEHWQRVVGGTPLARLLPARDVANAAITYYLGANLFSVIDPGGTRTEGVFDLARRLAPRSRLLTLRLPRR